MSLLQRIKAKFKSELNRGIDDLKVGSNILKTKLSTSPKLNFVDKVANNQFVQGLSNAGSDLTSLSQKFNRYANPLMKQNPQATKMATTAREFTASRLPTTTWGKVQRFAGENVPAMLIPASKGITAERIASPTLRLAANSLLRGGENAAYNSAVKVARGEKITPKQVLTDVATGAAFNAALSPKQLGLAGKEIGQVASKEAKFALEGGVRPGFAKLPTNPLSNEAKYLYHGTADTNLDSIAREGLKPGLTSKRISLSKTEPYATSFAESSAIPKKQGQGVVLRVNADLIKGKTRTGNIPTSDKLNELVTNKTIPPEAIEIKVNGKWQPLSTTPKPPVKPPMDNFDEMFPKSEKINIGGQEYNLRKPQPEITQQEADNMVNGAIYRASDKTQKKGFLQIFDKWIADKEIAKTTGAETALKYNTPSKEAKGAISELENGLQNNKYATNIRQAYDDLFKVADKLGKETKQDIAYRQNYLTHVWKNTPEQIDQAFAKLGKKFSFGNPREFASYEEGIKAGLTPRYNNPAQMIGEYVKKIDETKANLDFFNNLKNQGYIVHGSVGRNAGFVPINAQGFPQSTSSFNGQTFTGQWYAPKEIADVVNKVFNPQDYGKVGKVASIGAKISGGAQDILLSGGVPKTPLNAFTIAQTTKELLAGRLKSPITSMVKSLTSGSSQKFFQNNVNSIKEMQSMNIPIRTEFDIANVADRGWVQNTFGKGFREVWDKTVNTPTFKRFMPMLQVNLYNDIKNGALKAGRSQEEAVKIAGQAVRNFYGLGNTGKAARASKLGKDVVSATLFAPRYRESMINFWINNVKSLATTNRNQLMANKTNLSFIVGATATLITMDKLNKAINGHGMSENPDGKTDKLLIPIGGGKTLGIPFLSSIATVPRSLYATGKDLVTGDFEAAGRDIKSNISMSLKPLMDVANNENYFGSEIYNENDTAGGKLKASANYLLNPVTGAYTHPYLREGVKYAQGKQGVSETLSKATELPIRWYNTKSIENAPFWKEYENQKKIADIMSSAKTGRIDQSTAEKQLSKLSGKNSVPVGTKIDNGSYVAYKTSKGIKFSDTQEEADIEITKDQLKSSGKNFLKKDGNVYRLNKDGSVKVDSEVSYNTQLTTQKLENAKTSNNLKQWMDLASQQEKNLLEQLNDPTLDELDKVTLQQTLDKLYSDAKKYTSYGGFKKGKTYKVSSVKGVKLAPKKFYQYKTKAGSYIPKKVQIKASKVKARIKVAKTQGVKNVRPY